jgi:hypothetical protein
MGVTPSGTALGDTNRSDATVKRRRLGKLKDSVWVTAYQKLRQGWHVKDKKKTVTHV